MRFECTCINAVKYNPKAKYILKSNEMQIQLKKSKIELRLNELDELETGQELKEYLETLELSELIEIYYIQSCEISRIRKIILDSAKKNH